MPKATQHIMRAANRVYTMERKKLALACTIVVACALIVLSLVVLLVVALQPPHPQSPNITLSGEVACLPHQGNGPHTDECALGLHTDDDRYYSLENPPQPLPATGTRVNVTGTLTLPTNTTYDIAGVVHVTQLTR